MPETPEAQARRHIDRLLSAAGWTIQNTGKENLYASRGIAIREFPLRPGHGFADYLLYVDQQPVGVIEAKKEGATLTGYEAQAEKYSTGLPPELTPPHSPLPLIYLSTGVETSFTNHLDPAPRSRRLFAFHQPEFLADELAAHDRTGATVRGHLRRMPELPRDGLWSPQFRAIKGLEHSLSQDRPRSLIQMATGSGKTFTACNFVYRLIRHANARRILFLVDRNNLGLQTLGEFEKFRVPGDGRLFTELYNVQRLQSNKLDPVAKVCVTTIQRLFSMLRGETEFDPRNEDASHFETGDAQPAVEVAYNPNIPIETFDFIITDECHRSIYNLWRQVLEYFDAHLIGLTATPSTQTFGFFNQNLVMEYNHEQAVADGVNVGFDVYRISTAISEHGSTVEAGQHIDTRNRLTRAQRWEQLDEDLTYSAKQLDRDVVAPDQIRTVIRTFRDKLFTEIFPGRKEVPKTLIFAKDDSHADDIVQCIREEFGESNDFCEKFTYRTGAVRNESEDGAVTYSGGGKIEALLQSFRNRYYPRIGVTVDMIATGTDVKSIEIVFFMRSVRSRNLFEQMKGRGARVIKTEDLQQATPDAPAKERFVIVDAVGVCESPLHETRSLEKKPGISFKKLLNNVARGARDEETISSLAARLTRLDRRLTPEDRAAVEQLNHGRPLDEISRALIDALDPDTQLAAAKESTGAADPTPDQLAAAARKLIDEAAKPLAANPDLRERLIAAKTSYEQLIDNVTIDEVTLAAYSEQAKEQARQTVTSFRQFIEDNKDEITALQVLYSGSYNQRLTRQQIKDLAETIKAPPRSWTPDRLWHAYETLNKDKVRGSGQRVLTDIVSLIRFALEHDDTLRPFPDTVEERYQHWLALHQAGDHPFDVAQLHWLGLIKDRIAQNLSVEMEDFEYAPFIQQGGLGKARQVFGNELPTILNELNTELVA
jgi:type I restriction enzyme, R subunit